MKHFKYNDEIFAFEEDGSQDHLIKEGYVPLTPEEEDRLFNPIKYMTLEEQEYHRLSSFKPLTRRQFMRTLVLQGYDLDMIEGYISQIEDKAARQLALIDWKESTEFRRLDDTLIMMSSLLGLTPEQVDAMWEFGLTL